MTPMVGIIVAAVRANLVETQETSLDELSDHELAHYIFMTYRDNSLYGFGMRLSEAGCDLLSACFVSYKIELQNNWGPRDLLFLDRECAMPYFLKARKLVVFDQKFGVNLVLHGRDLAFLRQATYLDSTR